MVFSTLIFLAGFLPLFLLGYMLIPKSLKSVKNIYLLITSIIFYSWGGPKFIFVILATTFVDFFLVGLMDKATEKGKKKMLLIFSLCINLGLLFYFKYCNFFIDSFNQIFTQIGIGEINALNVVLPIGISFYTFESITYAVDVYRKVHKPLKSFLDYQLYIIFFPKLIAGPIVRYHEISDQIDDRTANETIENRLAGFYRFVIGLSKKVIIANAMAAQADGIFDGNLSQIDWSTAWLAALAYTFQIYFDFSGYSDMAIGIAKMVGFKLPENFNNPYISGSITEFWRRWHITLGSWMRNYLYIPLGGNRVSKSRIFFNLWLVFVFSGLWHGASWNFIIWGVYHGIFIVLEKGFLLNIYSKIGRIPSILINFIIVVIGWVFFRLENFSDAVLVIKKMLWLNTEGNPSTLNADFSLMLIPAILFSIFAITNKTENLQTKIFEGKFNVKEHLIAIFVVIVLFGLSLSYIVSASYNPFIYFRF